MRVLFLQTYEQIYCLLYNFGIQTSSITFKTSVTFKLQTLIRGLLWVYTANSISALYKALKDILCVVKLKV